ncbi:MAG: helix-turn-helix transcriptional regulator [Chloroflexi bacterium]|nr:helix-turn-helix transcriptional regulator [Chloroflexota bacterium]
MNEFVPQPMMTLREPDQIKAFTDPLRLRVLRILCERAATNQQIADTLQEPHAKVLYHVRFLLDAGLITLIDTQVKGGNVEKYYRARARTFDLHPQAIDVERDVALARAALDTLRQDFLASVIQMPEIESYIVGRAGYIAPERIEELKTRLTALFSEYIEDTETPPQPDWVKLRANAFIYRAARRAHDEGT